MYEHPKKYIDNIKPGQSSLLAIVMPRPKPISLPRGQQGNISPQQHVSDEWDGWDEGDEGRERERRMRGRGRSEVALSRSNLAAPR